MNCRDYEAAWNARFDARDSTPLTGGPLETHAARCPSCRVLGAHYQTLEQALRLLAPPLPSTEFVDRAAAAAAKTKPVALAGRISGTARVRVLAAAAAVLMAVGLGVMTWTIRRDGPSGPAVPSVATAPEPDDLTTALAEATSATLDLAREASAPAARVGRQVLIVAELPSSPSASGMSDEVPRVLDVWQSVGDRVNDGVRPLSGSARRAFGFLLGTGADDPAPPSPAPKRGA